FHIFPRRAVHAVRQPFLSTRSEPGNMRTDPRLCGCIEIVKAPVEDSGDSCSVERRKNDALEKRSRSDGILFARCGERALGRFDLRINALKGGKRAKFIN